MNVIIQKLKYNYRIFLGILLTILICTAVFCYYGNEKEIIFCDEVYTYTIVNHGIGLTVRDNRWYVDGEMDYRLNSSSGYFGYEEAIRITGEDVHPPIYYLIFKTFSMMFPHSTSKWIGFLAGYVVLVPMLALIYWGIWKISKKVWLATLLTVLFGVHPGIQGCALLIRMYFLLAFWFIVFYMQTQELSEKAEQKWWMYAALGITTFLGFMTQYYFAVYVIFFSVIFGIDFLLQKKWKQLLAYLGTMIAAVAASTVFFPKWIDHIFYGYKGQEAFDTLNNWNNYAEEIKETFRSVGNFVFPNYSYIYWILLVTIMICFFAIRNPALKNIKKHCMMHFVAQIMYYCIVAHVMPSVEARYFWSVVIVQMVMLIWMLAIILEHCKVTETKLAATALTIFTIIYTALVPTRIYDVPYIGVTYKEGRLIMEENAHIPWVYYGERNWKMHCSAFDMLIPDYLMYIRDLSTLAYDDILQSSQQIVVYAQSEGEAEDFVEKLEEVSGFECQYELLTVRPYNYVYLVTFQY